MAFIRVKDVFWVLALTSRNFFDTDNIMTTAMKKRD